MTDANVIKKYVKTLCDELMALPQQQRLSIADEIGAHLEARAVDGRLDEALSGLGSPKACATAYLKELSLMDRGDTVVQENVPHKRSLLTQIWGRISTIIGFAVTGWLYFYMVIFVLCIVFELLKPSHSGMWLNAGGFHWGLISEYKYDVATEVLGLWYLPLNILLVAGFFMLAEAVWRFSKRRALRRW